MRITKGILIPNCNWKVVSRNGIERGFQKSYGCMDSYIHWVLFLKPGMYNKR